MTSAVDKLKEVEQYWSQYTNEIQTQFTDKQLGTPEYFQEIKVHHDKAYALCNDLLDLPNLKSKDVLEIGCGIGLDALEYVKNGANVTAIDISPVCIDLAMRYFAYHHLPGRVEIANAEELPYSDNQFDVVVARQILMFTPDTERAVHEIYRVLKPGGKVLVLLHNRHSWYALFAKLTGTNMIAETKDPPVNKLHSQKEARKLFERFLELRIFFDRFPYKTNRRTGALSNLYNYVFVPLSTLLPKAIIRPFGWYMIISAFK